MKQFVQVLQKYQLTSISRPSLNFPKQSLETFFLRDVPHSNESSDFSSLLRLTLLTYTYTCRHPLHSRRTTRRPTHTSTSLLYSFSPHTHTHTLAQVHAGGCTQLCCIYTYARSIMLLEAFIFVHSKNRHFLGTQLYTKIRRTEFPGMTFDLFYNCCSY